MLKHLVYRGELEGRARRWFEEAHTPLSRLVRLALILSPLLVGMLLSVPVCPSALLAHIPCPGCGLTRASWALLQGDLTAASALNPLALVVCPLLVGAAGYASLRYVAWGTVHPNRWHADKILVGSMLALTVVWLARWCGYFGGPVSV